MDKTKSPTVNSENSVLGPNHKTNEFSCQNFKTNQFSTQNDSAFKHLNTSPF